jgi:hypothetical protein
MKLAVFEISRFDPLALRRWCCDPDVLVLSVNPPGEADWRRPPVEMTPYEVIAKRHERLCQSLFDAGARNEGPRLPGAEVSFLGAADFTLFIETRFATALLADLERLHREHHFERIEFVTDLTDTAKYRAAVRAFARAHQLPLGEVSLDRPRRGAARTAARALETAAETLWSHAPAYLDVAKAQARRWLHKRRSTTAASDAGRASASPGGELRAAMLVYHPKSWRYLLPIRAALVAAGHEALLISPRLECDKALEAAGVDFVSLGVAPPNRTLRRSVADYLSRIEWRTDDEALAPLVREGGALRALTVSSGVAACGAYANVASALPALLLRHRTNVVLGTDWGSVAGRCFNRTAARIGAETVFVQHGSLGVSAGVRQYMLDSYRLLWGSNSCQSVARHDVVRPERTIRFGSPFHERLYDFQGQTQQGRTADATRTVLVTFGVPGGYISESGFRRAAAAVVAAAAAFPRVSFVVKPHPGDSGKVWRQVAEDRALANLEIVTQRDTYDLMRECDLLLTMFSTTGSEAICMGKPVISINPDNRPANEEYLNAGSAYSVTEERGLIEVLGELESVPPGTDRLARARRDFAESFFHREDRPAAERTVDFLEGLVRAPQPQSAGGP